MSDWLRRSLKIMMVLTLLLAGCGKQQDTPIEPPGKLTGVTYERTVGMEWGSDFYVSVGQEKILQMQYFDQEALEYVHVQDIPLEEGVWESIEDAVAQMWPTLEEKVPQKKQTGLRRLLGAFRGGEPMALDGADRTDFSLVWETVEGSVIISYRWDNSDEAYFELAALLMALAPQ